MCHNQPHAMASAPWLFMSGPSQVGEDCPLTSLLDQNFTIIELHLERDIRKNKKKSEA